MPPARKKRACNAQVKKENTNLKRSFESFSSLLIPTMDSTRAIFLIEKVASVKIDSSSERTHPCLLLGDSGTAKTSTILLYKNKFDEKKVFNAPNQPNGEFGYFKHVINATLPTNYQYVPGSTIWNELKAK